MSKTKNQSRTRKLLAVLIGIAIIFGLFLIYKAAYPEKISFNDTVSKMESVTKSDLLYAYEINRYPSSAEIVELRQEKTIIGFDSDSAKLNFGIIPSNGSYSRKIISVANNRLRDVRIYLDSSGSITPFLNFSSSRFILKKGESREIEVFFNSKVGDLSAAVGNYTGEIDVVAEIPKYDMVYAIWGE